MKVAGALTIVAGLMLAALLALLPTTVSVLGTTSSCGPPVLRVFDTEAGPGDDFGIEQGLVDQCVEQSWIRLVIGGVLGVIGGGGGLLMLLLAPNPRPQKLPPFGGAYPPQPQYPYWPTPGHQPPEQGQPPPGPPYA